MNGTSRAADAPVGSKAQPRVFISHSSKDVDIARVLRGEIESVGGTCWLAPDDVGGTAPWADQILSAIEDADMVLVIVSEHSMTSLHVAREVGVASEMAKPMVPIRTDDTPASGAIRYHLHPLQWLDFRGRDAWREQLRRRLGGHSTAPPHGREPNVAATVRVRKTITILAVSVAPVAGNDPEVRSRTSDAAAPAIRAILERHGAAVFGTPGGVQLGFFGVPRIHGDDVARALQAAFAIRRALGESGADRHEASVGIAITTGELLLNEAAAVQDVAGTIVDEAIALARSAEHGEVLVDERTLGSARATIDAEESGAEGGSPYRVTGLRTTPAPASPLSAPLVGRQRELARLQGAFYDVSSMGMAHTFTVIGSAGVGKSRLVHEFLSELPPATRVLRGRCLPYGEGLTYWPLAEAIRAMARIGEDDTAETAISKLEALAEGSPEAVLVTRRVAAATGMSVEPSPREEVFWAFRLLIEHLGRQRPTVLVVDDLQWAERTLLDLLRYLTEWVRDAPVLLLCIARPELYDHQPDWGGGSPSSTAMLLEPLPDEAAEQLIAAMLADADLPRELHDQILRAADGVPLFIEEFMRILIADGELAWQDGKWRFVGDNTQVSIPPNIEALLAARVDQLSLEERTLAARASVVGRVFERAAMQTLSPDLAASDLGLQLSALVRKGMIRRDATQVSDAYRFRHLLLRDAAYGRLTKADRAALHARFADWLEATAGTRAAEYDEIIAYHFAEAYRYHTELRDANGDARRVASKAIDHLLSAGRRARRTGDAASVKLLERARELMDPQDPRYVLLLCDLAEAAARALGDLERGMGYVASGLAQAEAAQDIVARARLEIVRADILLSIDPDQAMRSIPTTIGAALPVLESAHDDAWLASALLIHAAWSSWMGRSTWDDYQASAEHARRAGDFWLEARAKAGLVAELHHGPAPLDRGIPQAEEILRTTIAYRGVQQFVLYHLAAMYALVGRIEEGRRAYRESRRIANELGDRIADAAVSHESSVVEVLAGEFAVAQQELLADIAKLKALGDKGLLATSTALLAQTLAWVGDLAGAEAAACQAEDAAAEDDAIPQVIWRCAKAVSYASTGRVAEARTLIRDALRRADQLSVPLVTADALASAAKVFRALNDSEAARDALERAIALYEAKGATLPAERARQELARLDPTGPTDEWHDAQS